MLNALLKKLESCYCKQHFKQQHFKQHHRRAPDVKGVSKRKQLYKAVTIPQYVFLLKKSVIAIYLCRLSGKILDVMHSKDENT